MPAIGVQPAAPAPPSAPRDVAASGPMLARLLPAARATATTPTSPPSTLVSVLPSAPSNAGTPPTRAKMDLTRAARSVMAMQSSARAVKRGDDGEQVVGRVADVPGIPDPWSSVLSKVRKTETRSVDTSGGGQKNLSLAQLLRSHKVKNLVTQAVAARQLVGDSEQSTVMAQWQQAAALRNQQQQLEQQSEVEVSDDVEGLGSLPSVPAPALRPAYGRNLLLEESCRRALAQSGEARSAADVQALKAWFQLTKLQLSTDFERLQPQELELLCRRMTSVPLLAGEVVFRQGDEGDALFLVLSGVVEVRVSQRVLGELVEVTVGELGRGDYFGERALLTNDVRAATVIAKVASELVRITRKDYDLLLRNDQLEFLSRLQMTNGLSAPRSKAQTRREYIKALAKPRASRSKADVDMLSEYLATLKFFRALPLAFVRELCSVVELLAIPAGAAVFREGEVGDLFYIIFSGSVDVLASSTDTHGHAQRSKLVSLAEGSHFGELALIHGRGVRSATVLAREDCRLLVICEKDYNATLRRLQKKDLAKRVAVLDQIPLFQTPEWTAELIKELTYVLVEQKLAIRAVLCRQGDKAQHIYFVVRGELIAERQVVDPSSNTTHTVVVERIGRFRMIGAEAACGETFNDATYRDVTVTASTPVEVLILSKYDVFHRLSRTVRDSLRTASHASAEPVVYLDRFVKSNKWEALKKKVLREHVDHERIERRLSATTPRGITATSASKENQQRRPTTTKASNQAPSEPEPSMLLSSLMASLSPPSVSRKPSTTTPRTRSGGAVNDTVHCRPLVDANEFLLLPPVDEAADRCFSKDETDPSVGRYIGTFNADAPPSAARARQLENTLAAEQRRQAAILNEGNPLAYFGRSQIQQPVQPSESSNRQPNGRRTRSSVSAPSGSGSLATTPRRSDGTDDDTGTNDSMNRCLQENFIFSHPVEPKARQGTRNTSEVTKEPQSESHHAGLGTSPRPETIEQLCDGDYVVVAFPHSPPVDSTSPVMFKILRSVHSPQEASDMLMSMPSTFTDDDDPNDPTTAAPHMLEHFVVAKKKFALPPHGVRLKSSEGELQQQLIERFGRQPPPARGNNERADDPKHDRAASATSTASSSSKARDTSSIFTSFQKVAIPMAVCSLDEEEEEPSATRRHSQSEQEDLPPSTTPADRKTPRLFATASIVLSKREITNAVTEEPFLCVHQLFSSEADAMASALTLAPPPVRNALICVLPVGELLHLEDAYEWCVQVEPDRREKRESSVISAVVSPNRNKLRHLTAATAGASASTDVDDDRAEAAKLHQFICARMGLKPQQDKDPREDTGFTPKPAATLEDKLAALQDYLELSPGNVTSGRSEIVPSGSQFLHKYRQMKRFGSIMRSRVLSHPPAPAPAPRSSVSASPSASCCDQA